MRHYLLNGPFLAGVVFSLAFISQRCHPVSNTSGQNVLLAKVGSGIQTQFADYWYKGEAEVSSYEVEQSRYGETRKAQQVMVFVTEDVSKSRQVKLDNPEEAGKDKVTVLKLNKILRFTTGIYDYSMMQSVFTPVDTKQHPRTLKTTTTVQDWCGHTFTQLNLNGNDFSITGFSYFENEGDKESKISASLLEDELWNRIRIDPAGIPLGEVNLVLSTFTSRLLHEKMNPRKARIRIESKEAMSYLIVEYLHFDRTLTIGFEPDFPHRILHWTEWQEGRILSKGEIMESIKSAYWKQNGNQFEYLRDTLKLQ